MILLVCESLNVVNMNAAHVTFSFQDSHESVYRNETRNNRLQLSDVRSVTDGGRFYCQAGNIIGTSSTSGAATVIVESKLSI